MVEMIGRGLIALAAVLVVIWLLARATAAKRGKGGSVIEVVGRTSLTKHASVVVLRIGDRDVLVGVSEHGVTLLGDADGLRTPRAVETAAPAVAEEPAAPLAPAIPLEVVRAAAGRSVPARHRPVAAAGARPATPGGALAGSALSPATWKQSVEALRELTVRSKAR